LGLGGRLKFCKIDWYFIKVSTRFVGSFRTSPSPSYRFFSLSLYPHTRPFVRMPAMKREELYIIYVLRARPTNYLKCGYLQYFFTSNSSSSSPLFFVSIRTVLIHVSHIIIQSSVGVVFSLLFPRTHIIRYCYYCVIKRKARAVNTLREKLDLPARVFDRYSVVV